MEGSAKKKGPSSAGHFSAVRLVNREACSSWRGAVSWYFLSAYGFRYVLPQKCVFNLTFVFFFQSFIFCEMEMCRSGVQGHN